MSFSVSRRFEYRVVVRDVPVMLDAMTTEVFASEVICRARFQFHFAERAILDRSLKANDRNIHTGAPSHRHLPARQARICSSPSLLLHPHLKRKRSAPRRPKTNERFNVPSFARCLLDVFHLIRWSISRRNFFCCFGPRKQRYR